MSSLREALADLSKPAPKLPDPEDYANVDDTAANAHRSDADDGQIVNDGVLAVLRRPVDQLGDAYKGSRVNRDKLFDTLSPKNGRTSSPGSSSADSVDDANVSDMSESEETDEPLPGNAQSDSLDEFHKHATRKERTSQDDSPQTFAAADAELQKKKGDMVRHQLRTWERLLSLRIKMQPLLRLSNRLPRGEPHWHHFVHDGQAGSDENLTQEINNCTKKTRALLDSLLLKQKAMLDSLTLSSSTGAGTSVDDEEIPSSPEPESDADDADEQMDDEKNVDDTRDEQMSYASDVETEHQPSIAKGKSMQKLKLSQYERLLKDHHAQATEIRNKIIAKWCDRVRYAGGRNTKKDFDAFDTNILKQISLVLSDKPRLIRRSQTKRSDYNRMVPVDATQGSQDVTVNDHDEEVFDDDDFYNQLLKQLIERKSNDDGDATDSVTLTRQWLEVQSMRTKRRRKSKAVDQKASKGRRIRYETHQKLVNFMAPSGDGTFWPNSAKYELFASLFAARQNDNAVI